MSSVSPSLSYLNAKLGIVWRSLHDQSDDYGYITFYSIEELMPHNCPCGGDHAFFDPDNPNGSCPALPQAVIDLFKTLCSKQSPAGLACFRCKGPINNYAVNIIEPVFDFRHKKKGVQGVNDECWKRLWPKLAIAVFAFLLAHPSVRTAIADCPRDFDIADTTPESINAMSAWLLGPSLHPETKQPARFNNNLQNVFKAFPFVFAHDNPFTPDCFQHIYDYRRHTKSQFDLHGGKISFRRAETVAAKKYRSDVAAAATEHGIVLAAHALNEGRRRSPQREDVLLLAPPGTENPFLYAARGGGLRTRNANPIPPPVRSPPATRPPPYTPSDISPPPSPSILSPKKTHKPYDRLGSRSDKKKISSSSSEGTRLHTIGRTRRAPANLTFNFINVIMPSPSGSSSAPPAVPDISNLVTQVLGQPSSSPPPSPERK